MPSQRLADRVAIVTGAGSIGPGWGNGKAVAVTFAREGATVVALDIRREAAEETCAVITSEGGTAVAMAGDVSSAADVRRIFADTVARFGRVDILHNNVGLLATEGIADLSEETWDRMMAVNLKGIFLTCREVLPLMAAQGRGAIVNVSSVAGIRYSGTPYVSYATSKGAILPFTRTVALEYASRGVRANCILPGLMDTPMIYASLSGVYGDRDEMVRQRNAKCPSGKMGDAWDVANAALFLASDEAKYVNGAELVVDGGLTCAMP